ncbi:proprotein convertase subtilisin/kexin type 9-like isoform X2 [Ptychodera flava]|uniref:proprotein convertase subtilisin/kexin type 9-like isoform X2 n=1 Tax=Ptychodera flava TaxID=63121 RepID=UPI00396A5CE7
MVDFTILVLVVGIATEFTSGKLTCVTRQSELSGTTDDDQARVTCEGSEQMTSCVSYLPGPGGHGTRDGEFIEVADDGAVTCVARNGASGNGVHAIARCCTRKNLKCGYAGGSQSGSEDDDQSWVTYDFPEGKPSFLTGCSVNTFWKNIDGAYPDSTKEEQLTDIQSNKCVAVNGSGGKGVWATAVYCSQVSQSCKAKWSAQSGGSQGDTATVSCDDGWVLTGCNSYTWYKNNDGAYITDADECVAVNGGNGNWVQAVAICCQE